MTGLRARASFRKVEHDMPPACPVVCDAGSYPKRPPFLFLYPDCPSAAKGSGRAIGWGSSFTLNWKSHTVKSPEPTCRCPSRRPS